MTNYSNFEQSSRGGFIKWIILIIITLLILSYYGFSLRSLVNSPTTQDNFGYVATTSVSVWDKYLKIPANYVWNDVFINLIWNPAINNLTKMKDGQPTNIQTDSPKLPGTITASTTSGSI